VDLEALKAFLAVIDTGSFLAAATSLRWSRATLRRRIDELEVFAGVPLLVRSDQGTTPTAAGELLARRGRALLAETSALLSSVREASALPTGTLRIVLPAGLPPKLVAMIYATQRQANPDLRIHARIAEDPLALVLDDVDVIFSFGGKLPEGPWVSHEMMRVPDLLLAHPDYLAAHGTPRTLGELSDHPILLWDAPERPGHVLPLKNGGDFPIDPVLKSSDLHVLRECAAAGLGIVYGLAPFIEDEFIAGPGMVPVLEDLIGRERVVQLVIPSALAGIPRLVAAIDYFRMAVQSRPPTPR
jgi:DNA-binding transcriptional LysR family regulator